MVPQSEPSPYSTIKRTIYNSKSRQAFLPPFTIHYSLFSVLRTYNNTPGIAPGGDVAIEL